MTPPVRVLDRIGLDDFRAELADAPYVALDTEFHAEKQYVPTLYLVQVHAPGGAVWLIDPLVDGLLDATRSALLDVPAWLVHAGHQDLRLMHRALGTVPERTLDTQLAAGLVTEVHPGSFQRLLAEHLDVRIDKAATLSDWSARPLTEDQIAYAADDVRWLPPLWDALQARVRATGREDLLQAACAEARQRAIGGPDPEGWRGLATHPGWTPRELAVLRALWTWREGEARRRDRPRHFVLGDALLRHLARARPTRRTELMDHRRLSPKTVERYGRALLEAVASAEALDPSELPDDAALGPEDRRRAHALGTILEVACHVRGCAPGLVAPPSRVLALARMRRARPEAIADALGPWRDALLGDVVADALSGAVHLFLGPADVGLQPPIPAAPRGSSTTRGRGLPQSG